MASYYQQQIVLGQKTLYSINSEALDAPLREHLPSNNLNRLLFFTARGWLNSPARCHKQGQTIINPAVSTTSSSEFHLKKKSKSKINAKLPTID